MYNRQLQLDAGAPKSPAPFLQQQQQQQQQQPHPSPRLPSRGAPPHSPIKEHSPFRIPGK